MVAAVAVVGDVAGTGVGVGLDRTRSEDSVRAAMRAISCPRAGMLAALPTAMMVAARVQLALVESDLLAVGVGGADARGYVAGDAEAARCSGVEQARSRAGGRRTHQRGDTDDRRAWGEEDGGRDTGGQEADSHRGVTAGGCRAGKAAERGSARTRVGTRRRR